MSETKSKWPMVIGGLLTAHALASLFFVYLATSNPSFAVEEDYYEKALAFDEHRAQDARNQQLGWSMAAEIELSTTPGELSLLTAHLTGASGEKLSGAALRVEAFPIARADHILRTELRADGEGRYLAKLPIRRSGRWELRFEVNLDKQRFTHTEQLYLTSGGRR